MGVSISPIRNSVYNEDIDIAGESIVGNPCVAFDMTITSDVAAATVVSIFDANSATNKLLKVTLTATNPTIHLTFPKGKRFDTGIYAAANAGSVDIAIDYD